jgi:hypothetical protein
MGLVIGKLTAIASVCLMLAHTAAVLAAGRVGVAMVVTGNPR